MGALQKNTPSPLGRACSLQEVRCRGTANESPGMMAGSTTGLSGAEGLSNRSSIGVSSLFFTMRADLTVITFRALPSIVTANTTRTGGSEENCGKERENINLGMYDVCSAAWAANRGGGGIFVWCCISEEGSDLVHRHWAHLLPAIYSNLQLMNTQVMGMSVS